VRNLLAPILISLLATPSALQEHTNPSPATPSGAVMFAPDALQWQPMPQFNDGRARALLYGAPEAGGNWVYRIRVPRSVRIEPHTHPVDEYITVIEGNWSFAFGDAFDAPKLVAYPAGSFVRIPANVPHFIATGEETVVIQSSGSGVFATYPADLSRR
jgi:quercetin dioxygenase-like cupin family protein